MVSKKVVFLDVDGTLFDTSERYNLCQKNSGNKRKFWDCFLSEEYMDFDKPRESVLQFVRIIDNSIVIILTGRVQEKQFKKTIEQLSSVGLKFDEIYMRRAGDFRKDFEFKASIIKQIIEKYKDVDEFIIIDDSDDVLNYVNSNFPFIKIIDAKKL